MKNVTEARKAAEANLISRHEETAAIRSQANTVKLLADNPFLMRMRELEVLEKIAPAGKLNVILREKGLADKVVNLLRLSQRDTQALLVRVIEPGVFIRCRVHRWPCRECVQVGAYRPGMSVINQSGLTTFAVVAHKHKIA